MRYPEFLKDGGRIGFIAPAFGCTTETHRSRFESAQQRFRELGYSCVLGPNCYEERGFGKSNTPEACGAEINEFFCSDRCDVIISCGGGETMCEDLPFTDFKAIADAPAKWFLGYSDNTNLVFTLTTLCDTAAVYGINACTFGQRPWHESVGDALALLRGERLQIHNYDAWELEDIDDEQNPCAPYNTTEPFSMYYGGTYEGEPSFRGRLLGGCLDVLQLLCGTEYDRVKEFNSRYREDGVVWFLEACELRPMQIYRALWQMERAGWFENARGFIFGRPMVYGAEDMGLDNKAAVERVLGSYNLPIIFDADIGHLPPMMPIISGAVGEVRATEGKLSINQLLI